jgi:hypothetical protein
VRWAGSEGCVLVERVIAGATCPSAGAPSLCTSFVASPSDFLPSIEVREIRWVTRLRVGQDDVELAPYVELLQEQTQLSST